jgi:lipopolysaccharide/colanic/teichoic acid biosynthesis glycosyltransferase
VVYRTFIKALFDFICALIALLLASPVIVILILLISFMNKGTPFFKQQRAGKDGILFFIHKFKSMTYQKDKFGQLLPDEKRLTTFGKILRKTSLVELPQLFNVIIGDMSFVGPRPLPAKYIPLYNDVHKTRSNVKPGISGWAQVNGRNNISWIKKFDLDVWYVQNQSFWLDVRIVLKTVIIVFKSEGVNSDGNATTVPFNGKN